MSLDLFTVTICTALVIVVSGVMYLGETLLRRDGGAGRAWSVAFLSGILTVLCYVVWTMAPSAYIAVAIGNAGFVASSAFVWIGCLSFNQRRLRIPGIASGVGMLATFAATLVAGPDGGDWAGAPVMYVSIIVFAALGAVETRRGLLRHRPNVLGLTFVLAVETVFFAVRLGVFLTLGPDSELFRTWFDSRATSLLTITLTLVTVVTASVLRAGESALRGQRQTIAYRASSDGVLLPASFDVGLQLMVGRSADKNENLCVIAVRMEDLGRVATAFGPAEADAIASTWREGVRRYSPTASLVGEVDRTTLVVAFPTTSFADVRRLASTMHRRIGDDVAALGVSVVPVIGVGLALTDAVGYDAARLRTAAVDAANRAATSPDATIMVAEG